MKRPKKDTVREATAALDSVRGEWLRRPGVTAVDVGFKVRDGQLDPDVVAVRAHVERKKPPEQLGPEEAFNITDEPDREVDGVVVDVLEAQYGPSTGVALDHADPAAIEAVGRKVAVEPLVGGVSCGNERISAGTLGAIVFDLESCEPMILSNWHVLAGSSAASVGEPILQPGKLDGGRPSDAVATLTRMELDERMDAAVATLNDARSHSRDLLGLGTIDGVTDAELGMDVTKSGRTTGVTRGVVDGISMSLKINYGDPGLVTFTDQIRIVPHPPWPAQDEEVSRGGDSGSVWLNASTNKAIGLHFAGETNPSPSAEHAVCSPIQPVADELGFSFFPVVRTPKKRRPLERDDFLWTIICALFPALCADRESAAGTSPGDDRLDDAVIARVLAQQLGGGSRCCCCCSCGSGTGRDDDLLSALRQLGATR